MRIRVALPAVALISSLALAQAPPGQAPQPQPQPQPTQPQPGREPGPGQQPQPGQPRDPRFPTDDRSPFGQRERGIGGKIVPSPSTRLRVELYQDSIRLDTTFTDMDGSFRFERQQPGRRYEIHIDLGPGVEYVEEVDFGSTFNYPVMIHIQPRGIHRTGPEAENGKGGGTMISLASLNVPKDAAKEFEKGHKARQKKNFDEAIDKLQKATEIYPKYAEAFNELGLVYRNMNKLEEAQKAFEQAIAVDPAWLSSYLNLANLQWAANKPEQLLETSNKVLKLNPTLGPAHFFQSVANYNLGRLAEAEKSALEADRNDHGQVPQVHLLLAQIYESKGARAEAVKQLRTFLKESPNAPNTDKVRAKIEELK